jgi:toxin ParE1/3/4
MPLLLFLSEIDHAISSILEAPRRWPTLEGECRRIALVRFPYFIVYREKGNNLIQVLAVAHGRRRPGYWRMRLD